ncbi:MAG: hypothetical protein DI535_14340 [Citrobacter freundii]|nr:MAG: hypothetical protein DI535_14340 [Citrobacter freundii]
MEWKYKKDFQAIPGIKLQYGKSGIKTNIVPSSKDDDPKDTEEKIRHRLFKTYNDADEIKSSPISVLTSPSLRELKSFLLYAGENYEEISLLLQSKQQDLQSRQRSKNRKEKSLFRAFYKKAIQRLSDEIVIMTEEAEELQQQLMLSAVQLEVDTDDVYASLYTNMIDAFNLLTRCEKKWDFTSSKRTNRVAERTSAANTVTRSEIRISRQPLELFADSQPAIKFHNMNGGDLYFYPGFMIVYESKSEFALISYADLDVEFYEQRFIEDEAVPSDSRVVDHTWAKVNKDGSRDKRFTGNYQIPVVLYGKISISSAEGLNEVYCFSNPEYTRLFCKALRDYCDSLKKSQQPA